jgi:hypothetical protein
MLLKIHLPYEGVQMIRAIIHAAKAASAYKHAHPHVVQGAKAVTKLPKFIKLGIAIFEDMKK